MAKIAMISDLHLDINRVDEQRALVQQSEWLIDNQIDVYLIAGDLYNHFDKSLAFVEHLQAMTPHTLVRFVAGNHDMVNDISYAALNQVESATYLHRRTLDVANTNWRIIGNNGWYDYSFSASTQKTEHDFLHWKRAYWIDGAIKQPMSDPERLQLELDIVSKQLEAAQIAHKQVLFVTHFVPNAAYIRTTNDNRFWNMANAMLGSVKMGTLLDQYRVAHVLFGHMHIHPQPRQLGHTWYYNQSVGYGTKRRHEWLADNFEEEWLNRVRILTLL